MSRFFIIVLDGVGAGELPDALAYGDAGSNTLGNLSRAVGGLELPTMGAMGLGNILDIKGVPRVVRASASWGKGLELSSGKDTITGHWEMMGIVSETPFPVYPDGFPSEIMDEFIRRIGREVLCNAVASGTVILEELGEEHMRTGKPIVYTSADSVFQIAAHEDVIAVDELYRICETAREILVEPHNVCRVIARPFVGPPFERTYRRRDFAVSPPKQTVLDVLKSKGLEVVSVGKIFDMFSGQGFTKYVKTQGNADGMAKLDALADTMGAGLAFANLVDFDTLWGHRNDTAGFKKGLEALDKWLAGFLLKLREDDYLILTADHGLDPTTLSTDHSREYIPILFYGSNVKPHALGTRQGFGDIGATVADVFEFTSHGYSFNTD